MATTPQSHPREVIIRSGGGHSRTMKLSKARALINRGRAVWVKPGCEIAQVDPDRIRATRRNAIEMQRVIDKRRDAAKKEGVTEAGYDAVNRTLTADELRHLPMTGDVSRLLIRR